MSKITTADFISMQARCSKKRVKETESTDGCDYESDLHEQILKHARHNGWLIGYSRMCLATTRPEGEPDFDLWLPDGKRIAIECKTRKGKLSPAQIGWQVKAEMLGHCVYVVRSYGDYQSILRDLNIKHFEPV